MHKFTFKPISEDTTINIIHRMHPKSSSGKDGISTILLKTVKHDICKPVTTILNQSLSTGIFPDKLKVAEVIPLFKKVIIPFFIITVQFRSYQQFLKYLKESYLTNYPNTSTLESYTTVVNMASERNIQPNLPPLK